MNAQTLLFETPGRAEDANAILKSHGYCTGTFGYYCDNLQEEVYIPAVWLLPHGRACAAYREPYNDGLVIDAGTVYTNREDAARAAHDLAALHAERERDYQQAWQAGVQYAEAIKSQATLTREYRTLARSVKHHAPACAPAVLQAAQARLAAIRVQWQQESERAERLQNGTDPALGWWTGDAALRAAFKDGTLSA